MTQKTREIDYSSLVLLHVDDEPDDASMIKRFVGNEFRLMQESTLKNALELLENQKIDIILLDLNFPESTGLSTLITVLNKNVNLPIVVLTGSDDDKLGLDSVSHGAEDYIVKSQLKSAHYLLKTLKYAYCRHLHKQLNEPDTIEVTQEKSEKPSGERSGFKPLSGEGDLPSHNLLNSIRKTNPDLYRQLKSDYVALLQKALAIKNLGNNDDFINSAITLFKKAQLTLIDIVDLHSQATHSCHSNSSISFEALQRNEKAMLLRIMSLYN